MVLLNNNLVNQSLVLRINPDSYRDGENRQLLVAAKRWLQLYRCIYYHRKNIRN